MSSIGPQIPAHLLRKREEEEEEEEDEDAYVPDLPPDLKNPDHAPQQDDEEDEDDIGPKPVKTQGYEEDDDPVREFMEREKRRQKAQEKAAEPKKLQREEWMLVPPSSSSLLGSLDPTKIKARQFSRNSATAAKSSESSLWTETPAEKQARIKEEVEGKRKRATDVEDPEPDLQELKRSKYAEQLTSQVESYNREVRGQTLVDMHQKKQKEEEKKKDKTEDVIWDHERDMSIGGRLMDDRQRSKMVKDAQTLSSRFSRGKGGYL